MGKKNAKGTGRGEGGCDDFVEQADQIVREFLDRDMVSEEVKGKVKRLVQKGKAIQALRFANRNLKDND